MRKIILAYVPVLHAGYLKLFQTHSDAKELCIFGADVISQFPQLAKNLPALPPEMIAGAIDNWQIFEQVTICDFPYLEELFNSPPDLIVTPDEDVTRSLLADFLPNCPVQFSTIFLRRDKRNTLAQQEVVPSSAIGLDALDEAVMNRIVEESQRSSDFWRQVGAAVVRDREVVLITHNHHVPNPQIPYIYGDPRGNFKKGIHIELSTAIHAEAALIAEAARQGISLDGVDVFVTTFPCPPCAKLLAYSGIKRLFYLEGYSMVDGQSILEAKNVEIILVK